MKEKMICRGDLFYYDFGDNSGSVQSGERPVLVVQADDYNQNAPTIIVAAVTSVIKKRYLPSHIYSRRGVWTEETVNGSFGADTDSQ